MDRLVVLTESEFTRGVIESTTMRLETLEEPGLNPESTASRRCRGKCITGWGGEIDEINNWSGSGDVIGIAAQNDGVHSPVGMAGAINGALPENDGSSVESIPGVYENSVGNSASSSSKKKSSAASAVP